MAATSAASSGALQALTAAALLLPGLACTDAMAQAEPSDSVSLQASHYRESARRLDGRPDGKPDGRAALRADSLAWRAQLALPGGNGVLLSASQDTWSGATPISTAPAIALGNRPVLGSRNGGLVVVGASPMINGQLLLDRQDRPMRRDPASGIAAPATAVVHTLSSASPETRQQLDLRINHRLAEDDTLNLGGGASRERDFVSRFVNIGRRQVFDLTTLTLGISHTRSNSDATLDHDAAPYITKTAYADKIESRNGLQVLHGRRQDWAASAGLAQVLGPASLLEATLSYTRSSGDLANPYKLTSVIFAPTSGSADELRSGDLRALLEQRPSQRRQWNAGIKWVRHIAAVDAALHLGYGAYHDDWGSTAHRLEAEWFQPISAGHLLSVRLRSYSQSAARFYRDYLVSHQAYRQVSIAPDGQAQITSFDPALLPSYFSSDQRLAAFGVLGFGLGWSQKLDRGLSLELGLDAARHAAALKWGGGNSASSFADFRYAVAHATLRIDFDALPVTTAASSEHAGHEHANKADHSQTHAHGSAPGGVALAHGAMGAGQWMLGYRLMKQRDAGDLRRNGQPVADAEWRDQACLPVACTSRSQRMDMRMQMLDIGYGLSDSLSLMLMPQYISASMESGLLAGNPPPDAPVHFGRHESGGWGDLQAHLLWQPMQGAGRWALGLGISAPTGSTDLRQRRSHQVDGLPLDYAMQSGSGTWDLLPSLSYEDAAGRWRWGSQAIATVRLQSRNTAGYALGNRLETSAWIGRRLTPWLQATLRAALSAQGRVRGEREELAAGGSAAEHPGNQGGRWREIGIGFAADNLPGAWQGSALAIEWLRNAGSQVNGYQPVRSSSLALSWRQHF